MTREILEDALMDNKEASNHITITQMSNIIGYVRPKLLMDTKTMRYYYEIDVEELIASGLPDGEADSLREQGWFFNSTKDKIQIFLQ